MSKVSLLGFKQHLRLRPGQAAALGRAVEITLFPGGYAGLRRVESCECGPETSCYGCLRGYRNQRDHEVLSRGAAAQFLADLGVQ